MCARASEPCFIEHARKSDPPRGRGRAVIPYIHLKLTNNKSVSMGDVFLVKYYICLNLENVLKMSEHWWNESSPETISPDLVFDKTADL